MRSDRVLPLLVCAALLRGVCAAQESSSVERTPAVAATAPAYLNDPKFVEAKAKAKEARLPVDERLARWKHANKIAKEECVECLHQIVQFQMQQSQWKDAAKSALQLDTLATEPREKLFAKMERGLALMHSNDGKPKLPELTEGEASLRAALEIAPRSKQVLYSEGRALALLGRDEEAKGIFQRYVDATTYSDPYRMRAEHFVENPKLAAMTMAPAFTLTTSEGEQMSLDEMGGKVVFVDFWATWCGPCKESLPAIKRIAKDFAGQPLVVLSISTDRDDIAWKNFIAKNEMTWPQYRDANGALAAAYGAMSIPRTFMIDTDGVLQNVSVGWGSSSDPESEVRRLVKKAVEAEKKKAKESERAANAGTK